MKKLVILGCLLTALVTPSVYAEWDESGGTTYPSDENNPGTTYPLPEEPSPTSWIGSCTGTVYRQNGEFYREDRYEAFGSTSHEAVQNATMKATGCTYAGIHPPNATCEVHNCIATGVAR